MGTTTTTSRTARTSAKAKAKPASTGTVHEVHQIRVGLTLTERVEGHTARKDSKEFVAARATLHKIIKQLSPNPWGTGPIQAHHGGSIWVHGGKGTGDWHIVLNWAGIEWSAQFCCDPAKVERLRQNAAAITAGFPATLPQLAKLGYKDADILSTPITDADGIARYVDSIWNSCVPIPQPQHTGAVTPASPLAAGVHSYPEPMCAIPRVMEDDFVPFVVDPDSKTLVGVAPVDRRHSGDARVRVVYTEKGTRLARLHADARAKGRALVLDQDNPIAKAAFAHQGP